jgi:hypothetical protein
MAERYEGMLREGVFSGELQPYPQPDRQGISQVLVLRSQVPSYSDEEIGIAGLRWASDLQVTSDIEAEGSLEKRYEEIEPELNQRVELIDGWRMSYRSTPEIDKYFIEYARLYLKRIFSQDLIGADDVLGGRPFSRYIEVLTALSGRAQRQIAFSAQIKARYPDVHIRNLLTSHSSLSTLIESIAQHLDADRAEIDEIGGGDDDDDDGDDDGDAGDDVVRPDSGRGQNNEKYVSARCAGLHFRPVKEPVTGCDSWGIWHLWTGKAN